MAVKIEHLRELLLVADLRSYGEAARRIHLTQSALSKHVAAVELELGSEVFDRHRRDVEPTEVGRAFLRDAAALVDDYDRALERVRSIQENRGKVLYIGYFFEAAKPFLGQLRHWYEVHKASSTLRMRALDIDELADALRMGKVDVAIMPDVDDGLREECASVDIQSFPLLAAVSWRSPLSKRSSVMPLDLADGTLSLPNPRKWPIISAYVKRCLGHSKAFERAFHSEDSATMFDLVENNQAAAIVAGYNRFVHNREVCFLPLDDPDQPRIAVKAFWLRAATDDEAGTARIARFRRALAEVMGSSAFRERMR